MSQASVGPGDAADCAAFEDNWALDDMNPRHVCADRRYDANAIRDRIKTDDVRATIRSELNRVKQIRWSHAPHRENNSIECLIAHLKIDHAFATGYDKLVSSFLDALHLVAIRKCL